jgi:hypothetical protein
VKPVSCPERIPTGTKDPTGTNDPMNRAVAVANFGFHFMVFVERRTQIPEY